MKLCLSSAIRIAALNAILLANGSLALAQTNEVDHGKQVFKVCAPCHAVNNTTRVGPGLAGVLGRHAGSVPGFRYSRAMKNAGISWDAKTLNAYITSPQKLVPGNRMAFSGIVNADDRAALVAYLKTLSGGRQASAASAKQ